PAGHDTVPAAERPSVRSTWHRRRFARRDFAGPDRDHPFHGLPWHAGGRSRPRCLFSSVLDWIWRFIRSVSRDRLQQGQDRLSGGGNTEELILAAWIAILEQTLNRRAPRRHDPGALFGWCGRQEACSFGADGPLAPDQEGRTSVRVLGVPGRLLLARLPAM